jgi:GTP-binding protein YchF
MSYKIGLVGLPNVGKSSLFNFLTQKDVLIANYPFATLDPNIGIFSYQDPIVEKLAKKFSSKKKEFPRFEIIDIAGLVEGASKGAGLGNAFLSHIGEVDLICHVVRSFRNKDIIRFSGSVSPVADFETIMLELILSDLQKVEKRNNKLKVKCDKTEKEKILLTKLKENLERLVPLKQISLSREELEIIKSYNFLTLKPSFVLVNSEEEDSEETKLITEYSRSKQIFHLKLPVKMVLDIYSLKEEEESIQELVNNFYDLFFLLVKKISKSKVFYTAGSSETKAWMVKDYYNARECASSIHTDIGKNFIKADIVFWEEFLENQKMTIRKEGANYLIKDGDVCNFLFAKNKI